MRITDFLGKLLPSFKKNYVTKELDLVANCYDLTIDAYQEHEAVFKDWVFRSRAMEKVNNQYRGNFKHYAGKNNIISGVLVSLLHGKQLAGHLDAVVRKRFQDTISTDGLTYQDANILQMCTLFRFHDAFARRLLLYINIHETGTFDNGQSVKDFISPADENYVMTNLHAFFQLSAMLVSSSPTDILSSFRKVPELVVMVDNDEALQSHRGQRQLDPLGMGFITTGWNPAMFIGEWLDDLEFKRYQEAKEDRTMLELRLTNLRNQMNGQVNPEVQNQIVYTQSRLERLRLDIDKFEEKYR